MLKIKLATDVWVYFLTFDSTPLVYKSIFMLVFHSSNYCSIVVSFKIRKFEFPNFYFPFPYCFADLGPPTVPYEFKDQFSYFCKNGHCNFDRDSSESTDLAELTF